MSKFTYKVFILSQTCKWGEGQIWTKFLMPLSHWVLCYFLFLFMSIWSSLKFQPIMYGVCIKKEMKLLSYQVIFASSLPSILVYSHLDSIYFHICLTHAIKVNKFNTNLIVYTLVDHEMYKYITYFTLFVLLPCSSTWPIVEKRINFP